MDPRPEYLPAAVWRFYRELRDGDLLNDGDRALVARLFAPEMAQTWRNMSRRIEPGNPADISRLFEWQQFSYTSCMKERECTLDEAIAELDWRHVFDLLLSVRLSFDKDARAAMARCRELLPEIAETAAVLATRLDEYRELSSEHSVSAPDEFILFGDLIRIVLHGWHRRDDPQCLPAKEVSVINPVDIIDELANAARWHEPKPRRESYAYACDAKFSNVAAWVRHFDVRWNEYQNDGALAARFSVGDTDLARIASAVLGLDVSREAVKQARARAKPQDDDEAELFTAD
ncbi:MAG: hypothetical protein WBG92_03100 [Thiohalocapsa sp.]